MRFKTKWEKFVITTIGISIGVFLVGTGNVKAALQANMATHTEGKKATGASWIQSIREMEKSGQTMGLNETVNADLTPASSNNIDVHMMRTTEYGAMAILSASGFGNPKQLKDSSIKSTTGNTTGVYIISTNNWEWTAGVCDVGTVGKNARYYDLYKINDQTSAKVGDALGLGTYTDNPGCSGWHGTTYGGKDYWINRASSGFRRGSNGYIFSFYGQNYWWSSGNDDGHNWSQTGYYGRGVAVVGQGL